jgi:IS1 family transposase
MVSPYFGLEPGRQEFRKLSCLTAALVMTDDVTTTESLMPTPECCIMGQSWALGLFFQLYSG